MHLPQFVILFLLSKFAFDVGPLAVAFRIGLAWQKVDMGLNLPPQLQQRLVALREMRREAYGLLQQALGARFSLPVTGRLRILQDLLQRPPVDAGLSQNLTLAYPLAQYPGTNQTHLGLFDLSASRGEMVSQSRHLYPVAAVGPARHYLAQKDDLLALLLERGGEPWCDWYPGPEHRYSPHTWG